MIKIILKSVILGVFSVFMAGIQGMDDPSDSLYDNWEMITHTSTVVIDNYSNNMEEDFELKAKAFGNTVISILGGLGTAVCNIGLNIIENKMQTTANQFTAGVTVGSHVVGSLYGQGVALRDAYENEKDLLKGAKDK